MTIGDGRRATGDGASLSDVPVACTDKAATRRRDLVDGQIKDERVHFGSDSRRKNAAARRRISFSC
jgi:hypothetical protein